MAIEFEFVTGDGFDFVQAFADRFNLNVAHSQVAVPDELGEGYIKEVDLDNGLKLCLHRYWLKQGFALKRLETSPNDVLTIKFDRNKPQAKNNGHAHEPLLAGSSEFAVEVSTSNLFTEVVFSERQEINYLVITVMRQALVSLLNLGEEEGPLYQTLSANQSFVFHEGMTPEMERILVTLNAINESTKLSRLLYQTKTQELIYLLFAKLLIRPTGASVNISQPDAEKLYALRASVLADLSITPQLPALARGIGMSETKMKWMFRQIFGDSIYNYYQTSRMNEAARLLTYLSVSETGYKLGFANLSHFTRLFEKHHHIKPKRYKDSVSLVPL